MTTVNVLAISASPEFNYFFTQVAAYAVVIIPAGMVLKLMVRS